MKNIIKILFGIIIISCNSQLKIMTERDFTHLYFTSLKDLYPTTEFKILSDLTINANINNIEYKYYLDNAYKEYKLQPDSIKSIIDRYIKSAVDFYPESKKIDIHRIVPIIKPISHLNDLKSMSKEQGHEQEPWIIYEKYNDDLIIVYAEDTEKNIRYFNENDFKNLNISKDTLLQFALNNLKSILPKIERTGDNGIVMFVAGGDYEASLMLMTSLWTKENLPVDGEFIIAIPNRDLLFITGSNDKKNIAKLEKILNDSFTTGNYPVSPYLFKWDGNKFLKYK